MNTGEKPEVPIPAGTKREKVELNVDYVLNLLRQMTKELSPSA